MAQVNYLDILNDAWQQHLAPRAEDAPTVVSLFAGAGGSSLGYSMAGYRELLAVEWDDNAVETFRLNFPGVPVYHGDIAKLTVDECMKLAGLTGPGQLDVLDGSPPCQGFSTAGKRVMDDPRNSLFREYVRLLRGLQPKVFIMENVSGLVKGKMKLIFAEIMRELKASGYKVSCRLMNAMYFHVPQSRQRLIWVGVREDLGREPGHPKGQDGLVTVREAWAAIVEGEGIATPPVTGKTLDALKRCRPGQSVADFKGSGFTARRLEFDMPSSTLLRELPFHRYPGTFHPIEDRGISIAEVKRIASFPDSFKMAGKYGDAASRIGNSVPPLFMRAIAGFVRDNLL
jgi:DNA (cytosine-5)-methyltransferase 1